MAQVKRKKRSVQLHAVREEHEVGVEAGEVEVGEVDVDVEVAEVEPEEDAATMRKTMIPMTAVVQKEAGALSGEAEEREREEGPRSAEAGETVVVPMLMKTHLPQQRGVRMKKACLRFPCELPAYAERRSTSCSYQRWKAMRLRCRCRLAYSDEGVCA